MNHMIWSISHEQVIRWSSDEKVNMIYGMVCSLISYYMIHVNNMAQTFHIPYLWTYHATYDMGHISYGPYQMGYILGTFISTPLNDLLIWYGSYKSYYGPFDSENELEFIQFRKLRSTHQEANPNLAIFSLSVSKYDIFDMFPRIKSHKVRLAIWIRP